MNRVYRFYIQLALIAIITIGFKPAGATSLPNCAGDATIDSNIEDMVLPNSPCGVLDTNIETISGNLFTDKYSRLIIFSDINNVTHNYVSPIVTLIDERTFDCPRYFDFMNNLKIPLHGCNPLLVSSLVTALFDEAQIEGIS